MIRLLSYNIRHALGLDGRVAPERIAAVIADLAPDVVALQEVDVGRARTGGHDQAAVIARALRMDHHFHPALHAEGERYGDAILTPHPARLVRAGALPGHPRRLGLEPRGALWVEVALGGRRLQVLNTHLGLTGGERLAQVEALLGPDWLGNPACREPAVLLGDLNATPWSRSYRRLAGRLADARRLSQTGRTRSGATFRRACRSCASTTPSSRPASAWGGWAPWAAASPGSPPTTGRCSSRSRWTRPSGSRPVGRRRRAEAASPAELRPDRRPQQPRPAPGPPRIARAVGVAEVQRLDEAGDEAPV